MLASPGLTELVEILATGANLAYIVLLIREKILCWLFGIIGSLLSMYLFVSARLYSEALLYVFYAGMGCYGWLRWRRALALAPNPVIVWRLARHLVAAIAATTLALLLGYSMAHFTDAQRPMIDAFTTSFSFLATYLEITKVLEAWVYWFCLNLTSIWLYHDRDLDLYAALTALYTALSVVGYAQWRRSYRAQASGVSAHG